MYTSATPFKEGRKDVLYRHPLGVTHDLENLYPLLFDCFERGREVDQRGDPTHVLTRLSAPVAINPIPQPEQDRLPGQLREGSLERRSVGLEEVQDNTIARS